MKTDYQCIAYLISHFCWFNMYNVKATTKGLFVYYLNKKGILTTHINGLIVNPNSNLIYPLIYQNYLQFTPHAEPSLIKEYHESDYKYKTFTI